MYNSQRLAAPLAALVLSENTYATTPCRCLSVLALTMTPSKLPPAAAKLVSGDVYASQLPLSAAASLDLS